MTRKPGELARAKLKMLEIYSHNPKIGDAEMGRLVNLDAHTVKKYKVRLQEQLSFILTRVEDELEVKVQTNEGIWQKLTSYLKK